MGRKYKIITLFIVCLVFQACSFGEIKLKINKIYSFIFSKIEKGVVKKNPYKDPFYLVINDNGYRLPILNPYRLIHPFTEDNELKLRWSAFDNDLFFKPVWEADSISVLDSIIYIHYNSTHGNEKGNYYLITFYKLKKEIYFKSRLKFLDYLSSNNIKEPDWLLIDSVYNEYEKNGKLPWLEEDND